MRALGEAGFSVVIKEFTPSVSRWGYAVLISLMLASAGWIEFRRRTAA